MPSSTPSCQDSPPSFASFLNEVLETKISSSPVWATHLGRHDLDHLLPDLSLQASQRDFRTNQVFLQRLQPFLEAKLDPQEAVDVAILKDHLEADLWEHEHIAGLDWDPLAWNGTVSAGLDSLVSKNFAPEAERQESFLARLRLVPEFLAVARERLEVRSLPHLEVALGQLSGLGGLLRFYSEHERRPTGLSEAVIEAEKALEEYRAFLEAARPGADPEGWRLGTERYLPALGHELETDQDPQDLLEAAQEGIREAQGQLLRYSRELLGQPVGEDLKGELTESQRATILEAMVELGARRATPETLVTACQEAVEQCRRFMLDRDLLPELPGDELKVELWPEHGRGVAVACLNPPGPYEGAEAESFFYISPPPEDWSEAQTTSFLKEYNLAQLLLLAAHEALPGHFAQLSIARHHPSRIRAIFGSGTYCEGWAVYCERMMVEQGLGGGDPAIALAAWKIRLRCAWNRVLDHWMHTGEKTPEQCLEHLVHDGFQERSEAEGKITRAKVTHCQLSTYFTGVYEMESLASDWKARHPRAPLKELHRALLEHGSVAPRHLRRLLF
jgi:uncharacterized protein (DUF885 family)